MEDISLFGFLVECWVLFVQRRGMLLGWWRWWLQDLVVRNRLHYRGGKQLRGATGGWRDSFRLPEKAVLTIHAAGGEGSFRKAAVSLGLVSGQAPQVVYASKSVAAFRLRKGDLQSVKVTLRGAALSQFLRRRGYYAGFPLLRDFEAIRSVNADCTWNYCFGSVASLLNHLDVFRKEQRDRGRPARHVQVVCSSLKLRAVQIARWRKLRKDRLLLSCRLRSFAYFDRKGAQLEARAKEVTQLCGKLRGVTRSEVLPYRVGGGIGSRRRFFGCVLEWFGRVL